MGPDHDQLERYNPDFQTNYDGPQGSQKAYSNYM